MTDRLSTRRVERADLPMIAVWLVDPVVRRWYPDGDQIDGIEEGLDDPRLRAWIAERDGRPVGYLQDYDIHGWHDHPLGDLPAGSRGIDLFLGAAADRGVGLGTRLVRQHAHALLAQGAPAIGIDSHPDNAIAIKAYERAGFVAYGEVCGQWGPALLMALRPDA